MKEAKKGIYIQGGKYERLYLFPYPWDIGLI